ncbi:MAG: hypothetical protein ACFHWZ_03845 [Phycisphaerales bacterium]
MPERRESARQQTYTNQAVGLLHRPARGFYRAVPMLLLGAVLGLAPQPAFGQVETPIYVDDAPRRDRYVPRRNSPPSGTSAKPSRSCSERSTSSPAR